MVQFIPVYLVLLPVALLAAITLHGLIEESIRVDMDRAHISSIAIRYRSALYSSSSQTAAMVQFVPVYLVLLPLALPAAITPHGLIEESIRVDMDRAHISQ
jgi:hypothetical protein